MPSKPTSVIADACARRASYLVGYTARVASRCPSEADRNQIFAGAYVSYVAFFEQQLEELFVGLVTGALTHPNAGVRPVVTIPNRSAAKSVIMAGRSYVDWLPYEQHTKRRAPAFLVAGAPFLGLGKAERDSLNKASILRNALAHQSDHSQRQFAAEFTQGRTLRTTELKPAGYLRGSHSINRSRFQVQLEQLVAVIQQLTH